MPNMYFIIIGLAILWLVYKMKKENKGSKFFDSQNANVPRYIQEHAILLKFQQQQPIQQTFSYPIQQAQPFQQPQFQQSQPSFQPLVTALRRADQLASEIKQGVAPRIDTETKFNVISNAFMQAYIDEVCERNSELFSDNLFKQQNGCTQMRSTTSQASSSLLSNPHQSAPAPPLQFRIGKGGRRIYKRKRVGERLRKVVASDQGWRCHDCDMLLNADFEIDHIIPVCEGGTNDRTNLVSLCKNCHGKKTTEDGLRGNF